jgi:hypothetical protein
VEDAPDMAVDGALREVKAGHAAGKIIISL